VLLTQQRVASRDALFTIRQQIPLDVANPLFQDGQRLVPSVTRTFSLARPLHVFLEAYPAEAGPLAAWVTFYREGRVVHETAVHGIEGGVASPRGAVPIHLTVPLTSLAPGDYACQVTVLDPTGNRATFWRAIVTIAQ
jgi:hypothetical protein